jgi:hypothetical protein
MEPGKLAIRRLINRIAPQATTRSEDGMIVVSIPLEDLAAEPGADPRARVEAAIRP